MSRLDLIFDKKYRAESNPEEISETPAYPAAAYISSTEPNSYKPENDPQYREPITIELLAKLIPEGYPYKQAIIEGFNKGVNVEIIFESEVVKDKNNKATKVKKRAVPIKPIEDLAALGVLIEFKRTENKVTIDWAKTMDALAKRPFAPIDTTAARTWDETVSTGPVSIQNEIYYRLTYVGPILPDAVPVATASIGDENTNPLDKRQFELKEAVFEGGGLPNNMFTIDPTGKPQFRMPEQVKISEQTRANFLNKLQELEKDTKMTEVEINILKQLIKHLSDNRFFGRGIANLGFTNAKFSRYLGNPEEAITKMQGIHQYADDYQQTVSLFDKLRKLGLITDYKLQVHQDIVEAQFIVNEKGLLDKNLLGFDIHRVSDDHLNEDFKRRNLPLIIKSVLSSFEQIKNQLTDHDKSYKFVLNLMIQAHEDIRANRQNFDGNFAYLNESFNRFKLEKSDFQIIEKILTSHFHLLEEKTVSNIGDIFVNASGFDKRNLFEALSDHTRIHLRVRRPDLATLITEQIKYRLQNVMATTEFKTTPDWLIKLCDNILAGPVVAPTPGASLRQITDTATQREYYEIRDTESDLDTKVMHCPPSLYEHKMLRRIYQATSSGMPHMHISVPTQDREKFTEAILNCRAFFRAHGYTGEILGIKDIQNESIQTTTIAVSLEGIKSAPLFICQEPDSQL